VLIYLLKLESIEFTLLYITHEFSNFCFTYHYVTKMYPNETGFRGVKYFHVN